MPCPEHFLPPTPWLSLSQSLHHPQAPPTSTQGSDPCLRIQEVAGFSAPRQSLPTPSVRLGWSLMVYAVVTWYGALPSPGAGEVGPISLTLL